MHNAHFRAWDVKNNCYFQNFRINQHGVISFFDMTYGNELYDESAILEMWTGLTDKNSKPIFEGDIITIAGRQGVFEIIWDDYFKKLSALSFDITINEIRQQFPLCEINVYEVIGNIHTDNHLLGVGE